MVAEDRGWNLLGENVWSLKRRGDVPAMRKRGAIGEFREPLEERLGHGSQGRSDAEKEAVSVSPRAKGSGAPVTLTTRACVREGAVGDPVQWPQDPLLKPGRGGRTEAGQVYGWGRSVQVALRGSSCCCDREVLVTQVSQQKVICRKEGTCVGSP